MEKSKLTDFYSVKISDVILKDLRDMIACYFVSPDVEFYQSMLATDYRELVKLAQDDLNYCGFSHAIARNILQTLQVMMNSDKIMVQDRLYLRAVRPTRTEHNQEAVGWHRESFYGGCPGIMNIWMPVANVSPLNSMQFIPGSSDIPDEDIETVTEDSSVSQLSAGHEIGLLYAPKKIVSGVDLSKAQVMYVTEGHAALFSQALIHGAGLNHDKAIRFSVDFRVISKDRLKNNWSHLGENYFVELN